jgi:sporulation protein YlmC with PRC-barrel domain
MSISETDTLRSHDGSHDRVAGEQLLSASSITGDDVYNPQEEKLGTIQDIMLDVKTGKIRYAVLSSGGLLGMGNDLYAVPWDAFALDAEHQRFILDIDEERLKAAPSFDKDAWPNMADPAWNSTVESHFSTRHDGPRV